MTLSEDQAVAFKNDGNKAFAAHDWPTAIDFYTKAIELDDQKPTYYSNRAQANIKSEAYGYAIADATKAIELDPNFVKAYYRRAVAYTAILKSKDALRDFKTVVRKAPNDKDAKLKLAECEKIVKRVAFLQAIDPGDEPSAAQGLDLDSMVVDANYDGARLEQEMTQEFISDMLERFKNGKKIHKKYVYQIILAVKRIVYDEATMVEMEIEDDANLTVCGDTHGRWLLLV
ncbi:hypothetical protein ONS96_006243 [Cadophora gregata f. sp. sojae]|nr:hypothetical protein ONS96_006243 [Cadophora gregata f. sp. sojae]